MKRLVSIALGAFFVVASTHGSLWAQVSGYGAGGGMGGASGGGTFGSSGTAFGSSGSMFSSSGSSFSAASGGSSGFNMPSFATTGTGTTAGMVGMSAGGMYGATGSGGPNARGGMGSSYQGSSQYGSRSGQGQYSQYGSGGQGRTGGGRRGAGTQGQGQPGQGGTNKETQPWFEPRIDVGFAVAGPAPTAVQTSIAKPFHTPALSPRFGTVNVSVQGSTVVLRGTVSSEEDRELAAQMAMLEPSVFAVQNDLRVASPAANPPR